ncbi:hypothetical protein BDV97DRAFT_377450 [Delphinella strobiligena]|nr:hypothetical protein BDV97DRAFT_377450 [Delphinella strobiligena]
MNSTLTGHIVVVYRSALKSDREVSEVLFEAATYELLRDRSGIRASRLLYYRCPVQHPGAKVTVPRDLSGRRLFVFQRAAGVKNVWEELTVDSKSILLDQLAHIRAALFRCHLPLEFAAKYLHERIFDFKPESFATTLAPSRAFWMHVLEAKINATIRTEGDMIGWEDDKEVVGSTALAAKQSLLRAIPYIMPLETPDVPLYRFVLEHGDFGIHNTSITIDADDEPLVTSLYDWETACIVPALLSDPLVAAGPVDLITNEDGEASVTRIPKNATATDLDAYAAWAQHYLNKLYHEAPDYGAAIRAGKDVQRLWFELRDWRGGDSEHFFGELGAWAKKRIKELSIA